MNISNNYDNIRNIKLWQILNLNLLDFIDVSYTFHSKFLLVKNLLSTLLIVNSNTIELIDQKLSFINEWKLVQKPKLKLG